MNVNFNLKDFLAYFKKTSFKIAFLIGISLYKFWLLDSTNVVVNNIVTVIFILAVVFLLDDIFERIIGFFNKKLVIKKYIKELQNISDPQVLILIAHYFENNKNKIDINSTSYFNVKEGEYQILKSKLIIFQATSMSTSFSFPFTLQEWAYNELTRAVDNKEIYFEETKKEYIIHWYDRQIKCDKDYLNDYREYNNELDYM